ncbi:DUF4123 domain-containing protein [Massilia sp.]|uniref:DUF4123 domain-containing protein n=1 Tax=Massilia sp. TaxID=1882437 RepID=UPI002898A9E6|nr:DUF4123 domain-containing protein [Massilia sp.]
MSEFLDLQAVCEESNIAHPSNVMYCLADHAGMPGLHRQLVHRGLSWASLFETTTEQAALSAAPLLFALPSPDDETKEGFMCWLAEHGTYTSSILLLSSPFGLDELCSQLARRMHARITDGMDVLLRYFDPRVFESLLAVLDEQQASTFLSPADCWWYPDRSGKLICRQSVCGIDAFVSPLQLAAEQEFAMIDASEIDVVEGRLRGMFPDLAIRVNVAERELFLRRHMAAAHAAGIESTNDMTLYCGLAVIHGEHFADSSPWREILAKVRGNSAVFSKEVLAYEEQL